MERNGHTTRTRWLKVEEVDRVLAISDSWSTRPLRNFESISSPPSLSSN